jgi:L-threonylcarbamoyladenylate synthase
MTVDIPHAVSYLNSGGILIYPTDTVYGLGCLPSKSSALQSLLSLKNRRNTFIVLIDDWSRYQEWIDEPVQIHELKTSTPTTWVFKASLVVPTSLQNKHGEIAMRQVCHEPTAALLRQLPEPLVSTSANNPGGKTPSTHSKLSKLFPFPILIGNNGNKRPSSIIHYTSRKIIRP